MRALLLAAGKATRLGEISDVTPKCLHQIGDEVLLDRLIRQLREVGVTEFLINTHHLAEQIANHIGKRPDRDSFKIVYETSLLGTLGTTRVNADFFGSESGWVLHADNFIEGSLASVVESFVSRPKHVWGSLLTFHTAEPRACGVVVTDSRGVVTEFYEKAPVPQGNQASAATFLFSSRVFDLVRGLSPLKTDISLDLLPLLVGRLVAVAHSGSVIDIGTVRGLLSARALAASLRFGHYE